MQNTIKTDISCQGVGLHSGLTMTLRLVPAKANSGISFVRTDVTDKNNVIPARWDNVVDTRMCTVLANAEGVSVGTVEHLMSALRGCNIDNITIEIDGPELPILDGSSGEFVTLIKSAGLQTLDTPRKTIRVTKEITFTDGDKTATLKPFDGSSFSFEIDFDSKAIGKQNYEIQLVNGHYAHNIAKARTFGFTHEVEQLKQLGLAKGGSLDNAIVVDGDTVLNEDGLRFDDEFVRHKILDSIGDLYLAGAQIQGHFHGVKAGHALNNKLLHTLFADDSAWEWVEV